MMTDPHTCPITHDRARSLLKMGTEKDAHYLELCQYVEQQRAKDESDGHDAAPPAPTEKNNVRLSHTGNDAVQEAVSSQSPARIGDGIGILPSGHSAFANRNSDTLD